MITEKDLQEAIAECEGQRNPNANTCIKLAAFYTIKRELFGNAEQLRTIPETYNHGVRSIGGYSGEDPGTGYDSGTEFSEVLKSCDIMEVLPEIDELISAVQVLNPRLYNSFMRKITER